jgi:phosphoenolpyruvate-protein phosphotransferase (PTS system enzyme I)
MTVRPDTSGNILKGIPVSPGIILGKAHLVDRSKVKILYQYLIDEKQLNMEVERFRNAVAVTKQQLETFKDRMPEDVKQHAFILDSHLMILKDSMLRESTVRKIEEEKINAEWALKKSFHEIEKIFSRIDDEYISNRIQDVESVTERILRNLSGDTQESLAEIKERVIIVAHNLSPADTSELNVSKVMGFITDVGGRTSHTAIMAQSLEIPAIVGLESATLKIGEGDLLIVDGNNGDVIINPDDSDIIYYQEKQLQHEKYKSSIARTSHLPAETSDGYRMTVKANIEFLEEVAALKDYGAEGIGLYRTEFLYLRSRVPPTEQDLFADYREVVELMAPEPVTIRTLDLGGDKFASGIENANEANPALGLRAIRLFLKKKGLFKTQLRAILRASIYGNVRLMFPMISGLQEVLEATEVLNDVKREMEKKEILYDENLPVGVMIEIPAAVAISDLLAQHVDFFSIGTNDLIQFALAIDRVNEHVAFMYQPFHPAILRMIRQVVEEAREAGIQVSVCGEMAGDPLCIPILLALGVDELSMNARAIPMIKNIIRSISLEESRRDFDKVIQLSTASQVRDYLLGRMKQVIPELDEKGYLRS